jgi:hypothetical protein
MFQKRWCNQQILKQRFKKNCHECCSQYQFLIHQVLLMFEDTCTLQRSKLFLYPKHFRNIFVWFIDLFLYSLHEYTAHKQMFYVSFVFHFQIVSYHFYIGFLLFPRCNTDKFTYFPRSKLINMKSMKTKD